MNKISGCINMNKKLVLLLLTPLLLTSCSKNSVSFEKLKEHIDNIENTGEHPYYRVNGSLDFNGIITEIGEEDGLFDKNPNGISYVANARYYEGFYNAYTSDSDVDSEEDVVIFAMASRSYWLRAPLRIHKDNYYVMLKDENGQETDHENPTCAHHFLDYLICAWLDANGSVNASTNKPCYEILSDGGFAIGGKSVRTKVTIDNYPYYLNYSKHPELGEWDEYEPLPCYKSVVDGRFDIRFEYDKDGWLKSETLKTVDYDYNKHTDSQVALKSVYTYKFSD